MKQITRKGFLLTELFSYVDSIDKAVVNWFQVFGQGNPITPVVEFLTNQRNFYIPMALAYIAMIIWGGKRGRLIAILLIPMLFLTDFVSVKVLKPFFGRPRPLDHGGFAMPSAHATNLFGAALMFCLGWVKQWWGRVIVFTVAFCFAFTRIYVGVHYPSDILVGAFIGMMDCLIIIGIFSWLQPGLGKKWSLFSENIFLEDEAVKADSSQ
jgi:undecaprenyl-diphosphatase